MAENTRLFGKVPKQFRDDGVHGTKRDPGPYIGIVKNNVDPSRSGKLQVFIADFGGDENEESQWIPVGYASPYMGSTRWPRYEKEKPTGNEYDKVNHTYGMWMSPPDVGNSVLVVFVNGRSDKGYWFASIIPELSHYAMPGGAGSMYMTPKTTVDPKLIEALTTKPYPVVEFNDVNQELWGKWSEFLTIEKPPHEEQCFRLLKEGLEDDKIRGVITSSSQRESPSRVFGISTPGPESAERIKSNSGVDGPQYRLGGHTLVMDDGNVDGKNRIVRIRTSAGHQIMMSDSDDFIYVANAQGTAWFEMTASGKFYFYGADSISMRSEKDVNFHADKSINMYAGNSINMFSNDSIVQESDQITGKAGVELNLFGGAVGIKSSSKLSLQSDTIMNVKVGTNLVISATGAISLKADKSINTQSTGVTSVKAGESLNMQSATQTTIAGGEKIVTTADEIHFNGPAAPAAPAAASATAIEKPKEIQKFVHVDPVMTMKQPYYKWKPQKKFCSTSPIVPTHEPYGCPKAAPARAECCNDKEGGVAGGPVYKLK